VHRDDGALHVNQVVFTHSSPTYGLCHFRRAIRKSRTDSANPAKSKQFL
jgi:hypothetical protein